jgi:hypothetical protein
MGVVACYKLLEKERRDNEIENGNSESNQEGTAVNAKHGQLRIADKT